MSSDHNKSSSYLGLHLDGKAFRKACGTFATGIAVAAVIGRDGKPHGLTINSFTSVSLDPPLVLLCIGHKAASHGPFSSATTFSINILSDAQSDLSTRFASSHPNRFEGVDWFEGELGSPVLGGSLAVMKCEMRERVEAGDHTIFIGLVRRAEVNDGAPLVYFSGSYRELK
ncbi:MAG: flavin reductase family protein [Acidobacteria bacterium]|nr:flavin reductase family protein [Acidobacteriota bacterium]